MENQPSTPTPRSNRRRRLWLVVPVVLLAVVMAFAWLRGGGGTEGGVRKTLDEVRRQEKNSTGTFARFLDLLPGPLVNLFSRSSSTKGDYEFTQELVKLGTNTVPSLVRAVAADRSVAVRKISVMALGDFGLSSTVSVLTNALAVDQAFAVRQAAVSALREIGDKGALPALKSALRGDKESIVRGENATALATLGGAEVFPDLLAAGQAEKDLYVRKKLAEAFGELRDESALPVLIGWFKEEPPKIRVNRYPRGRLSGESHEIAEAIGRIGGETAYQALTARWQADTNSEIRMIISEAWGNMGDLRALPLMVEALNGTTELKSSIAKALGNLGDAKAVAALTSLLEDADENIRNKAVTALGQIGSSGSVVELKRLLAEDASATVRLSACSALGMIGDVTAQQNILDALPQLKDDRSDAIWALGHLGSTNCLPALAGFLTVKSREERFAAAYALVEIGGPMAADALAANLADEDEFAAHGKACALTMLGRTNGLAVVRAGLRAKEDWRRFGSALALARLGNAANLTELKPMLEDGVPTLRRFSAASLEGRVGPGLVEMLHDRKKDYGQYAARALLFLNDPATLPALREACKDGNPSVRDAARLAVRRIERLAKERP